jgi:hypothetical protein
MICRLKAGASQSLNSFGCSARLQVQMFQPLRSIAGSIYRVSCTRSIYVHLVISGTPPSRIIFYSLRIRKSPLKMAFGGPVNLFDLTKLKSSKFAKQ